jgi:hypothetical protein
MFLTEKEGKNLFLVALSGQGTKRISFTAESLIIWLLDGFFHVTGNRLSTGHVTGNGFLQVQSPL